MYAVRIPFTVTIVAPCRAFCRSQRVSFSGIATRYLLSLSQRNALAVVVNMSFPFMTRRVARVAPLVLAVVIQTSVVAVLDITQLPCRDIPRGSREGHGARVARLTASARG